MVRNLTDTVDGLLRRKCHLILDRDAKYSEVFRRLPKDDGIEIIRPPPRSPNLNAYAERFLRSIKEECLNRMIFLGEASLRHTIKEYLTQDHAERNHQGMGNQPLTPLPHPAVQLDDASALAGYSTITTAKRREL